MSKNILQDWSPVNWASKAATGKNFWGNNSVTGFGEGLGGKPDQPMPAGPNMQYPGYQQGFSQAQFTAPQVKQETAGIGQGLQNEVAQQESGISPYSRLRMSQADQQARSTGAEQMGALAAKGGLRSGAAERIGDQTAKNALGMRANIGTDEQNMRAGNINSLAQLQMGKAGMNQGANQFDQSMYARAAEDYNKFNLGQFQTMGSLYGDQANAEATANSGKK